MGSPIEKTEVYRRSLVLSNALWNDVTHWSPFARDALGGQLVRSLDSVAANLVEGNARGSDKDASRFFVIARASAREARHWLVCAESRGLLSKEAAAQSISELTEIVKMVNGLITHRRTRIVKEESALYDVMAEDELSPFLTLTLTPNP
jgi:four helix bundle protein